MLVRCLTSATTEPIDGVPASTVEARQTISTEFSSLLNIKLLLRSLANSKGLASWQLITQPGRIRGNATKECKLLDMAIRWEAEYKK